MSAHAGPARGGASLDAPGQANARTLSAADVEAVALRLAELLAELLAEFLADRASPAPPPALVDVAEVARRYGVSPWWVYDHADELGVVRLGTGKRAHLRFDLERVAEAMTSRPRSKRSDTPPSPGPDRQASGRRPRRLGTEAPLLPIRGEPPCP